MAKTLTLYSNIGDYYDIKKGIIKYKGFIPAKSKIKPGNRILIQPVLSIDGACPGYGIKVGADLLKPIIKTVYKVWYYGSDNEAFNDIKRIEKIGLRALFSDTLESIKEEKKSMEKQFKIDFSKEFKKYGYAVIGFEANKN